MRNAYQPVRIGLIGAGHFGRVYAGTLVGLAECELAFVVEPDSAQADLLREHMAQPELPVYRTADDALRHEHPDAWIVASSTRTHVQLTRQLLAAGQFVLCEKPLAVSVEDAMTLEPLIRANSQNLMVGHVALFNSEFRALLAEHRRRETAIRHIAACRHRPVSQGARFPGESPLDLLMVHDLYLIQSLMTGGEPTSFDAAVGSDADGRPAIVSARISWGNTTVATLTASFLTPDGMADDGFERLEVFADGWTARIEPNPRPLQVWDTRARWPLGLEISTDGLGQSSTGMLAEQIRCFARGVRGMAEFPVGTRYQDAVQVLRWKDALHQSIESKREVTGAH